MNTPIENLSRLLLTPELELIEWTVAQSMVHAALARKISDFEVCPKCATPSRAVYDHRWVTLRDIAVHKFAPAMLKVSKRRFSCRPCGKPFTEPIPGVRKGGRVTQRFKEQVMYACEKFRDLKSVTEAFKISTSFVYNLLYERLEAKRKERNFRVPRVLGMDEHAFRKNKEFGHTEFVTMLVDHGRKRLAEVALGRSGPELKMQLASMKGWNEVKVATIDMCEPFRQFLKDMSPQAAIVADKFHVVRLLNNALNQRRKEVTGDKRSHWARRALLKNNLDLSWESKKKLEEWLLAHPKLAAVYWAKERLHGIYRHRNRKWAQRALRSFLDKLALSGLEELQRLRKTLLGWREEILNYFTHRVTNARTEGFNNKAKVLKRMGYGYRSFQNYRLRLLNHCC